MTTLRDAPHPRLDPLRVRGTERCQVMGIVNVTPDSFSDGGRYADTPTAAERGLTLLRQGADIVDAGAVLVNDVSGGLADPGMLPFLAEAEVPCVLMHWRAHSRSMHARAVYRDVVEDVRSELASRCDTAVRAGVSTDRIVLDPGLGFAKTAEHGWAVPARLPRLLSLGFPVLVGASRKAFLADLAGNANGPTSDHGDRDDASAAVATFAALAGSWGVRVHAAPGAVAGCRVAARLVSAPCHP